MSNTASGHRPISRRTVAAGAAWSIPAVISAGRAPAWATSQSAPCDFAVDFAGGTAVDNPVTRLVASDATGRTITITVASQTTACTAPTTANLSNRSDSALSIRYTSDGCTPDWQPTEAPAGHVVLNQAAASSACTRDRSCDQSHPSQTLTFTFTEAGQPVTGITELELDVIDITAITRSGGGDPFGYEPGHRWADKYKDTIAFDVSPTSIVAFDAAAAGLDENDYAGVGEGTLASPYQRLGLEAPTVRGITIKDTFQFAALRGNSIRMTYGNAYYGHQFVVLGGLRFRLPCRS